MNTANERNAIFSVLLTAVGAIILTSALGHQIASNLLPPML